MRPPSPSLRSGTSPIAFALGAEALGLIDSVEAQGQPSPRIRVAFEVDDVQGVTSVLTGAGADLVSNPEETPWRSLNSRLNAPGDLQLTIFEELDRD